MSLEFLAETNIAGQTLLRLVSRGSAIIAELLRLSEHIPQPILDELVTKVPNQYSAILFDFRYLKTPDFFDRQINTSTELSDIDEGFFETHEELLGRFYQLFESIFNYITDYSKYLTDLNDGFYIQNTIEGVLLDNSGRQLMCEALYLMGIMLIIMDLKLPGHIRERLIVAWYRHKGEGQVPITEVSRLCRDSGFNTYLDKRPANYPEDYLGRFPIAPAIVNMIIGRLRSDDVYNQARIYPSPEHRPVALSQQASMLYVILYFSPKILHEAKPIMREIVDKHFSDNWVISIYMGMTVDLSVEWDRYKAAKEALYMDTIVPTRIVDSIVHHQKQVKEVKEYMSKVLVDGYLTEAVVVDSLSQLIDVIRRANISLRWILLQRLTSTKKVRELIHSSVPSQNFSDRTPIFSTLLEVSLLEYKLKMHIRRILSIKTEKWASHRDSIATIMTDLAEYFSGNRALTRVEKDEGLMGWFSSLSTEVRSLDCDDAILAGRKIRQLIKALEEVSAFDAVDSNPNVKEFIALSREGLMEMVRTVNITERTLADINTLSDFSYAWELIREYVPEMHARISSDPTSVLLLRALFLKMASVLDVPMVRIVEAKSPDALSVAEYYSGELVSFLRVVLEVVPVIVFRILREIIMQQTRSMRTLPVRLEHAHLREYSQLPQRYELAKKTHDIGVFTEGVLAMEKTLLGVIQVNPRQILNEGIAKHMVDQVARALNASLTFDFKKNLKDPKSHVEHQLTALRDVLDGFKRSFEYVQDYISVYGLRMWQEQYSRVILFFAEQECNRYMRKKVRPDASSYQSKAVPVPLLRAHSVEYDVKDPTYLLLPHHRSNLREKDKEFEALSFGFESAGSITFLGSLVEAISYLTSPARTVYGPGTLGGTWFDISGRPIVSVSLFVLLNQALSIQGLMSVDKIVGLEVERTLRQLDALFSQELKRGAASLLQQVHAELAPLSSVSSNALKLFPVLCKRLSRQMDAFCTGLVTTGHLQLLRRAIAHELKFSGRSDSNLLSCAVEALDHALLHDVRLHYQDPTTYGIPDASNPLIAETASFCEALGLNEPLTGIYINSRVDTELQPLVAPWLAAVVVAVAPKLQYDQLFGSLVARKLGTMLDGSPLIVGIATMLRQMNTGVTDDFLGFLGQYVRSSLHTSVGALVSDSSKKAVKALAEKPPSLPPDIIVIVIIMQQLARVARIPERVLHAHVPAHIFDTIQ